MREFAEQEIIIPEGPYEGRRFRCDRQPYSALLFDAIDSGNWNRFIMTGPSQSGKTLCGSVIPVMYHLFELGETVIFGLPDMDMAADKWREDLEPAIARSRYRDQIPRRGGGSRGGKVSARKFRNGQTLRFMTGGGGDKSIAGYTSRVLVVTEVDGMDTAKSSSREADRIAQFETRLRAWGSRKRVYMECTVSIDSGRTWREYQGGTASRIAIPCVSCGKYVCPEREHLSGWQDAETAVAARAGAAFCCPECGVIWTEDDRKAANSRAVLLHRGQEVRRNRAIVGNSPATETLGFRWSAVNNLFVSAGDVGLDEWKAKRAPNEESSEKEMLQFVWALPHRPTAEDDTPIEEGSIQRRIRGEVSGGRIVREGLRHGVVPPDTMCLTMAVDCHKFHCNWVVAAWQDDGLSHVVDYGVTDVPSRELGVEEGLLVALRRIKEFALEGWSEGPGRRAPDQVWIDSGNFTEVVYTFVRENMQRGKAPRFRPTKGLGESQERPLRYSQPKTTGNVVRLIGEGYHFTLLKQKRVVLVEVNGDYWKSWIHRRLVVPTEIPGALTLFDALPKEHLTFAKHITAERREYDFQAGKGTVETWVRVRRENHYLDCIYNAAAAAHYCGFRLIEKRKLKKRKRPRRAPGGGGRSPRPGGGRGGFISRRG